MNRVRNSSALPLFCSGRFGRRRIRVNQCWLTLKAEESYDSAVRLRQEIGERRTFNVSCGSQEWRVETQLLPNRIWRHGRMFFVCQQCRNRATRLYVPSQGLDMRCRSCWGLSYESRSWSYHPGFMGWSRDVCLATTESRREERKARSRIRQNARSVVSAWR